MANVLSTQDVRSEGRGARWGLPCAQRTAGISSTLASNLGDKQYSVASAWQEGNLVSGSLSDVSKVPCY